MSTTAANREEWLDRAIADVRILLGQHGAVLPPVRASCGFPSKGARATRHRTIGECWGGNAAKDGIPNILVSPVIDDPAEVLGTLIHEAIHAAVGCEHGHRKPFADMAKKVGLEGKMTETVIGEALKPRVALLIETLGPYPHGALSISGRKKDGIRQRKAQCPACGTILRMSRKAASGEEGGGLPYCGCKGPDRAEWVRYKLEGAEEEDEEGGGE